MPGVLRRASSGGGGRSRGIRAAACLAVLLVAGLAAGCAMPDASQSVTSAGPPAASAAELREAARLHREGLRANSPPLNNPDLAARLIEAAATMGDPDAQLLVAAGHLFRSDGGRDAAAAAPWLNRAAHQGSAEAQYRLAQLLEAGEGLRREPAWAALWFQRAAERGHPEAQFALALMQVVGEGTARDEAEALARMTIAEGRGVAPARRYREALQRRVPPAQARATTARLRGETARGPATTPDRALVRFAQSALAARGAWSVPVDGRDGPAIRAALAGFARQQGIAASGPYDPAVIDRLRAVLVQD